MTGATVDSARPLVSIISAVFNEEQNIRDFHAALSETVEGCDFDCEIILVDDGSTDASAHILRSVAVKDARVRVLRLAENSGSLTAYNCGLAAAGGDAAVLISADLQDPPSLILEFVSQWKKGSEVVWAVRENRDDPFAKSLLARSFYTLLRLTTFPDYPRDGTDTCLFSRAVIDSYRALTGTHRNPIFEVYAARHADSRVPYHRRARTKGKSGWPLMKRLVVASEIIAMHANYPRLAFAITSALSAFFGLLIVVVRSVQAEVINTLDLIFLASAVTVSWLPIIAFLAISYLRVIRRRNKAEPEYVIVEEISAAVVRENLSAATRK